MRISGNKLCAMVIAVILLTGNLTYAMSDDGYLSQTFKGDNYHEITAYEADRLFKSGDSFILLYFSYNCGITLSRIAMFQQLMDEYDVEIYGLNGLNEKGPRWMWEKFTYPNGQAKSISYPVVCTVLNKNDYVCLDGSYSMREQVKQISDYLQITEGKQVADSIWKGFLELNSSMKARERTDPEALSRYLESTEIIQSDDPEIMKLSYQITGDLPDDYSKIKAIHDWVADNIIYDMYMYRTDYFGDVNFLKEKDYTASGTLKSRVSVCAGYANLTAALTRSTGIPCKVVTGFADGNNAFNSFQDLFKRYKEYKKTGDEKVFSNMNRNHAWNEAFVNGRWVILDTTWDSNNEDRGGNITMAKSGDKYFDIDLDVLSETHAYWDSEFYD